MGFIRLLLAVSVLIAHAGPLFGLTLIGGKMAVQSFFIISGFYMALILNEKYIGKNGSYRLYITNRFLRIFPLYWLILLLTCLLFLFLQNGFQSFIQLASSYHPVTMMYLILTNLFMLGQDWGMFLEVNKHGLLYFSTAYEGTTPFVYLHLLVPQGWTLAIELTFYLLAPFLVKRRLWLIIVGAFASLLLRLFLYAHGLHHEPWTNRFFPTELLFFLLGILSYRIFKKIHLTKIPYRTVMCVYIGFLCLTFLFPFLPKMIGTFDLFQWVYYVSLVCSMPFFFYSFQKSKIDAYLGELAYPLFVSHFFIIYLIRFLLPESLSQFTAILTLCLTILLSILLLKLIAPITTLRLKRVKK
jgi:peptidoglycan/LPS O-acetylase OafA/YrhL